MLPQVAETNKMSLVAELSFFSGAWSPCATAFSCVACRIRACFNIISLVLASSSASSGSFRPYYPFKNFFPCHAGIGNLPYSWKCFFMLVKRWPLESQEDACYY